jgi:hypothetical protein
MKKQDKNILIRILLLTFGFSGILGAMNFSYASIGGILGVLGVGSLLVIAIQIIMVLLGLIGQLIITVFTAANGGDNTHVSGIKSIFFNHNSLTTAAYFADGNFSMGLDSNSVWDSNNVMYMISQKVTTYYYVMRNLAIAILLFILLYIAVRMATTTLSKDEAKYKRMLVDWGVSLALVFVLHYIMIITFYVSNSLVSVLEGALTDDTTWDYTKLILQALVPFTGFGEAIIFLMLIGMELTFLFMYIKRIIVLGFLILIAPLITVTYSLDKIGDTKSQALNTWMKEFIYNVIIQPFHCILYITMINTVIHEMADKEGFGGFIVYIIVLQFVKEAEEIIKRIFNIQAGSMPAIKGMGTMAIGMFSAFGKVGKAAGSAAGSGKKMPDMTSEAGSAAGAAKSAATVAEKGAADASKNAGKGATTQTKLPQQGKPTTPSADQAGVKPNSQIDSAIDSSSINPPQEPIIVGEPGSGTTGGGTVDSASVDTTATTTGATPNNGFSKLKSDARDGFRGALKYFVGPDMDLSTKEGQKDFAKKAAKKAVKYGTTVGAAAIGLGMSDYSSAIGLGMTAYGLNDRIDSSIQEYKNNVQLEKNEDVYDDKYSEMVEEYSRLTGETDEDKIRDTIFDAMDKYDEGQLSFDSIKEEWNKQGKDGEAIANLQRDFLKNTYSPLKKSYEVDGGDKGSELVKSHTITDSSEKYKAAHES